MIEREWYSAGEESTKRREGEILRRMAGSVPCHREVKEDKCEVSIAFGTIEVISEMRTLLAVEVRGVGLRRSNGLEPPFMSCHHFLPYPSWGLLLSLLRLFLCQHLSCSICCLASPTQ